MMVLIYRSTFLVHFTMLAPNKIDGLWGIIYKQYMKNYLILEAHESVKKYLINKMVKFKSLDM